MKKVFLMFVILAGLTLTSCRKSYMCSYESLGVAGNWQVHEDLSRSEAKDYKKVCQNNGGNWVKAD